MSRFAANTGGAYRAEDVTAAAFQFGSGVVGTGVRNFNAAETASRIVFYGASGTLTTAMFGEGDVIVRRDGTETRHQAATPPHVHQPLIQTIVDELRGRGRCESTGESGARTSWVMDRCLERLQNLHG